MPLLDSMLEKKIRMIDFEPIKDPITNDRLVAFGRFAGIAGAFDFLRGCGEYLL
jgi:alpha-aminoadipic semialdehyde synthase